MEKLKLYTVTKSSSDGTLQVGDIIWLSDNGDLNNAMCGGWLSEQEWNIYGTNDFEVEQCTTHYLDIVNRSEVLTLPMSKDRGFLVAAERHRLTSSFLIGRTPS